MGKAISGVLAVASAITLVALGWWLGKAGLGWMENHPGVALLTQPWLFPAILGLLALSALLPRKAERE